jgi:hypothetical protein
MPAFPRSRTSKGIRSRTARQLVSARQGQKVQVRWGHLICRIRKRSAQEQPPRWEGHGPGCYQASGEGEGAAPHHTLSYP